MIIIYQTSRRIWRTIYLCRKKYWKIHVLSSFNRKISYKNWEKWRRNYKKPHHTDYNLLILQDLWQSHYKILLMILLNDFMKIKVNTDMLQKNVKIVELNGHYQTVHQHPTNPTHPHSFSPTHTQPKYFPTHHHPSKTMPHSPSPTQNNAHTPPLTPTHPKQCPAHTK